MEAYEPPSLRDAIIYFAEIANCLTYMVAKRWPNGVTCPTCGSTHVGFLLSQQRWQCSSHHPKRQFSIKTGTIFEDSPLGLDKWLPSVWLITNCKNGISSWEVSRALDVTQKTAWFMLHRVRLAMQDDANGNKLGGEIEIDETFVGGKARNMHKHVRDEKITDDLGTNGSATKASVRCHESPDRSKAADFAVDGAIHYARLLSRSYNVVAVAVSGQTRSSLKVSSFVFSKGSDNYSELKNESCIVVSELIPFDDFVRLASYDPAVEKSRHDDLMTFSRELHDFMRDYAKLTESEKPLLVSGTLIALRSKAFANGFGDYAPEELQKAWMRVIREEIEKADLPNAKKSSMTQPYSSIAIHPELGKSTKAFPKGVLHELISLLFNKVWRFVMVYQDFDVVGRFYGEFLKYTGGDKKSLGIVLTPRHITELFALLANVKKDSKVLDTCCGTGGFLVSAMHQMLKQAVKEKEQTYIKKHCLIGVEQQPNMYALAASNMILRGDGKANLYQGSCFDAAITRAIKDHHCNIGLINPPYSQEDEDQQELKFVQHMLDSLEKGGTGIAIVPMSCAISPHAVREELLKHHTLEAVMSMPDELFYPVGVITCIMVFTAHLPHAVSKRKTWFGYWKTDGFFKTKHKGRIDGNETWASIRDRWVSQFRNREVQSGQSVTRHVTHKDEWCAEAYMETDYSTLSQSDFERELKNYVVFQILNETPEIINEEAE